MTFIQKNFSNGVISKLASARSDASFYGASCIKAENAYVRPEGSLIEREGLKFVTLAFGSVDNNIKLIEFKFGNDQSFVLEFTAGHIRFFSKGSILFGVEEAITNIVSNAGILEFTGTVPSDVVEGSSIFISVDGLEKQAYKVRTVDTLSGVFTLEDFFGNVVTGTISATTGTYRNNVLVVTDLTNDQIPNIHFTQNLNSIYLTSKTFSGVKKVERISNTNWTYTSVSFGPLISPPQNFINDPTSSPITVTTTFTVTAFDVNGSETLPSAPLTVQSIEEEILLRWDAVAGAISYNLYKVEGSVDFSGFILSTTEIFARISVPITADFTKTPPNKNENFAENTPYTPAIHQQRLVFGGGIKTPATFYASKTGIFNNFSSGSTVTATSAITQRFEEGTSEIRGMLSLSDLFFFTSNGVYSVKSGDNASNAFTADTIYSVRENAVPCAYIQPVDLGSQIFFIHEGLQQIHTLNFSLERGRFATDDLSLLASDLLKNTRIKELKKQEGPFGGLFVVLENGNVLFFTYISDSSIRAWTEIFKGLKIQSLAVIPEDDTYGIYVAVEREVSGKKVRFIEELRFSYILPDSEFFCGLDSYLEFNQPKSITNISVSATKTLITSASHSLITGDKVTFYNNALEGQKFSVIFESIDTFSISNTKDVDDLGVFRKVVSSVSGLSHLESETVYVIGDGDPQLPQIVKNGAINLSAEAAIVYAGLSKTFLFESVPLTLDRVQGFANTHQLVRSAGKVWVEVVDTGNLELSVDGIVWEEIKREYVKGSWAYLEGFYSKVLEVVNTARPKIFIRNKTGLKTVVASIYVAINVKEQRT